MIRSSTTNWRLRSAPAAICRLLPLVSLVAILLCPTSARAINLIDIAQSAALDQPQINLMLSDSNGPRFGHRVDFGDIFGEPFPTPNIVAYLDTGASGILIGGDTAADFGLIRSTVPGNPSQEVVFHDIGVSGTESFGVSQSLYASLAPFNPNTNIDSPGSYAPVQVPAPVSPNLRMQLGQPSPSNTDLGEVFQLIQELLTSQEFNVVGMPAMQGKVVVMDPAGVNSTATILGGDPEALDDIINGDINELQTFFNNLELRTSLHNPGDGAIPTTSHHVKLSYGSFDNFSETVPNNAPGPTLAHNPFVGPNPLQANPQPGDPPKIKIGLDGRSAEGSFLLDTGAAASMISKDMANQLHVRYKAGTENQANAELELYDNNGNIIPNGLRQFRLTVGGVGGDTTLAGFFLDSMLVRTMEGNPLLDSDPNHLNYLGAPVLVHDISLQDNLGHALTLDGIFGMNFMVASLNLIGASLLDITAEDYTPGAFDWITFDEPNGILGLDVNPALRIIAGDFNHNGHYDAGDIDLLYQHFGNAAYDLDGSGNANQADVDMLLAFAHSRYGDANLDGGIGPDDFTAWRLGGIGWAHGDFNGDGGIGPDDFTLWRLGPTAIASGGGMFVPEPSSFVLLAIGGMVLTVRIRRRTI